MSKSKLLPREQRVPCLSHRGRLPDFPDMHVRQIVDELQSRAGIAHLPSSKSGFPCVSLWREFRTVDQHGLKSGRQTTPN